MVKKLDPEEARAIGARIGEAMASPVYPSFGPLEVTLPAEGSSDAAVVVLGGDATALHLIWQVKDAMEKMGRSLAAVNTFVEEAMDAELNDPDSEFPGARIQTGGAQGHMPLLEVAYRYGVAVEM